MESSRNGVTSFTHASVQATEARARLQAVEAVFVALRFAWRLVQILVGGDENACGRFEEVVVEVGECLE